MLDKGVFGTFSRLPMAPQRFGYQSTIAARRLLPNDTELATLSLRSSEARHRLAGQHTLSSRCLLALN